MSDEITNKVRKDVADAIGRAVMKAAKDHKATRIEVFTATIAVNALTLAEICDSKQDVEHMAHWIAAKTAVAAEQERRNKAAKKEGQ